MSSRRAVLLAVNGAIPARPRPPLGAEVERCGRLTPTSTLTLTLADSSVATFAEVLDRATGIRDLALLQKCSAFH
jgi:hypothetical protein